MGERAIFVNKINVLCQEFHYATQSAKITINNCFNSSFYGSHLWDLFSIEADRLEKSWNISQRILLDTYPEIPIGTLSRHYQVHSTFKRLYAKGL